MDKFRKTFSVRKKKENEQSDSSKPQLWIEDERKIKEGSCSFQVKYLGCIEVFESRGMQVCEEAIKALRKSKKKAQRSILYVSGDALRVSDEISKHLIVDQTIEKVSFCAPDRGHDKGFAYICRDGATRRWMCHAFLAVKESGERLSHAVGCAFAICLERKQKRERDAVQATYANEDGSFVRMSSFRQTTLSERLLDPQSAIVVDHNVDTASRSLDVKADGSNKAIVPFGAATLPKLGNGAIPRPRANPSLIERQTSLRLFPKLQETSPFKHHLSMRANSDACVPGPLTLQSTNLIMNGTGTIPEEPSTELDEAQAFTSATSANNHSMPFSRVSLTPQPSQFAFHNPNITSGPPTTSSAFPVSFDDLNSIATTIYSTAAAAPTFTTSVTTTSSVMDTSLMALDPFSAAPVNPATIQQHQAAQKQQLQRGLNSFPPSNTLPMPPSKVPPSLKPATESSPTPKVAAFPVTDWPEVAAAASNGFKTSSFSDSNGHGNASFNIASADATSVPTNPLLGGVNSADPKTSESVPMSSTIDVSSSNSAMALFGAEIKAPSSVSPTNSLIGGATTGDMQWPSVTATGATATALVPWLQNPLSSTTNTDITETVSFPADPFDLGWAERATAKAQGQLAAISSTLPLSLTAALFQQPSPQPASCSNPFLPPPLSTDGTSAGFGF